MSRRDWWFATTRTGDAVGRVPRRRTWAPPSRSSPRIPALMNFMNREISRKRWRGKRRAPGSTTSRRIGLPIRKRRPTSRTDRKLRAPRITLIMRPAILAGGGGRRPAGEEGLVEGPPGLLDELDERRDRRELAAVRSVTVHDGDRLAMR